MVKTNETKKEKKVRKKAHIQNIYLIRILNPRFNKGRKRIDNEREKKDEKENTRKPQSFTCELQTTLTIHIVILTRGKANFLNSSQKKISQQMLKNTIGNHFVNFYQYRIVHTYIIGLYNPLVRTTTQLLTSLLLCVLIVYNEWRDQQFKVNSE